MSQDSAVSDILSQDTMDYLEDQQGQPSNFTSLMEPPGNTSVQHTSSIRCSQEVDLNPQESLELTCDVDRYLQQPAAPPTLDNNTAMNSHTCNYRQVLNYDGYPLSSHVALPVGNDAFPDQFLAENTTGYSALPVPQLPPQSPQAMGTLPTNSVFPGEFDFKFSLGKEPKQTKSAAWTFSPELNKLYSQKDMACPLKFKITCSPGLNAGGLFIRALPIYKRHESMQEPVKRCPNHIQESDPADTIKKHFVCCDHPSAEYVEDPNTARLAVVIPFDQAQAGTDWVTCLYTFRCLNSCPGGPNKRELGIIFTLENIHCEVLGRQFIDIRVCACPGRDRKGDEKKFAKEEEEKKKCAQEKQSVKDEPLSPAQCNNARLVPTSQPSIAAAAVRQKRPGTQVVLETMAVRKRTKPDNQVFNLTVVGEKNYSILKKMRDALHLSDAVPEEAQQSFLQNKPSTFPNSIMNAQGDSAVTANTASTGQQTSFTFVQHAKGCADDKGSPRKSQGKSQGKTKGCDFTDCADGGKRPGRLAISTLLQDFEMSAYLQNFAKANLVYVDEISNFSADDFRKLALGPCFTEELSGKMRYYKGRIQEMKRQGGSTAGLGQDSVCGSQSNLIPTVVKTEVDDKDAYEVTRCSFKLTFKNKSKSE